MVLIARPTPLLTRVEQPRFLRLQGLGSSLLPLLNWCRYKYPKINPKFIFINLGFNLRPTDITAAIGNSQFKKLNKFIKIRNDNSFKIKNALINSKKWDDQFSFQKINPNVTQSLFGFPIFIHKRYSKKKKKFLEMLDKNGIETRPIISGNFLNQPAIKLFKLNKKNKKFPEAQKVENLSFFIGLHSKNIRKKTLNRLVNTLLKIDIIQRISTDI